MTTWDGLLFWKSESWNGIQKIIRLHHDRITPDPRLVFRPFLETPLLRTSVVFVFPDPYANGSLNDGLALSYSTNDKNTYEHLTAPYMFSRFREELLADQKITLRKTCLKRWANQGVLLWNSSLTTLKGLSGAHKNIGWTELTLEVLETVYLVNPKAVFVFVGTGYLADALPAEASCVFLPIPLYHNDKFSGTRPFSLINAMLRDSHQRRILWAS